MSFEITQSEENNNKTRVRNTQMICGIPSGEPICELLGFQKEKRVRRGQKA